MSNFDYNLLQALYSVVREGSFEAAAKSLKLTQSAVSQRVKQLETKLGGTAIIRGRPCVPTALGLELYRHVEQIDLLEHQLTRRLDQQTSQFGSKKATLKIAVNSDSLSTWFPAVIQRADRELLIQLDITADDQDNTSALLSKGEAVAAVTSGALPIQGFRRIPLGAMEYVAIASPAFIEKYFGDGCTRVSIQSAPALSFSRSDTLPQKWLFSTFNEEISISGHRIPSNNGYLKSCMNGVGWGLMPTNSVSAELAQGHLIEIVPATRVSIPLYWQSSTKSSEVLSQLVAIVVEETKRTLTEISGGS